MKKKYYTPSDIHLKQIKNFDDWLYLEKITNTEPYLKYDPEKPIMTPGQQKTFWETHVKSGNFIILGIYNKSNHELIAHINAFDYNTEKLSCEIGINVIPPENFGKGIGYAAIPMAIRWLQSQKNLISIYILTHIQNIPSQKLFAKCGFKNVKTDEKDWVKMVFPLASKK